MTKHGLQRTGAVLLLLILAIAGGVMPQFLQPHVTRAQTVQTTTPLALCGTITSVPGGVSFAVNGANIGFTVAQVNTFTVPASLEGHDVCFVGQLNSSGQITSGTLTANYNSSVVLCGAINAYTPSTITTPGQLTLGSTVYPIGVNAQFSGTALAQGTSVCINGTVNGLSQLVSGAVSPISGSTAPVTPISACGTLSAYTAPGASTAGTVTLTTPTVSVTYPIVAAATVNPSGYAGTLGNNVCLVGTLNAAQQLTAVTFSPNAPTSFTLCGVIGPYAPASSTTLGSLAVGPVTVILALSAAFTGQPLVTQSNVCITGSLNSLGQVTTATVGPNPNAPTATPTITPTATVTSTSTATSTPTATATQTGTTTPQPTATNTTAPTATATATATASPTATSVPPTATPTPKPAKPYRARFSYVSVWYHVIRVGSRETIVVQAKKHVQHGIWATVKFPSGLYLAYYTNTDSHGFWSASFIVPKKAAGKYTNEGTVNFQLWYKNTTAKSYVTFNVV